MCEMHDISSVYYYSLSQIINPNFRPVYDIDLRFESLIKNIIAYYFYVTSDHLSNFISPRD